MPVIASSASVFEQDREESLNAGCSDFLPKPVKAEVLFDKTRSPFGFRMGVCPRKSSLRLNLCRNLNPCSHRLSEHLTTLFELAKKGKIVAIREQLVQIEQLDDEYATLCP